MMLDTSYPNLRQRLRHALAPVHEALDAKVSAIDLTVAGGFSRFLGAHRAAYGAIMSAVEGAPSVETRLTEVLHAIDADLEVLEYRPTPLAPVRETLHPVAVDHVTLGSRLGLAVLRRSWEASSDPKVGRARSFFALPSLTGEWRDHCDRLSGCPSDTPSADRVFRDTRHLFDIFSEAFDANL